MATEEATGTWIFELGEHEVELSEMVPTEDGNGRTRQRTGVRKGKLTIEIDFDALKRQLGERALRNARKRAHIGGGAVLVKATGIKDTKL
jgi:hypothetical protein